MRTTPIFVPNGIKIQQRKKKWAAIEKKCPEEANNLFILGDEEANIFVGGGLLS